MLKQRRHLTPDESRQWAQAAQISYLAGLATKTGWSANEFAFHGGTSLHMSWMSPRFSEDLDFLVSRDAGDVGKAASRALQSTKERFSRIDPLFKVELRDKSKDVDRMQWYELVIGHPNRIGNSMVKVEFWKTDPAYIAAYPKTFRTPVADGSLVSTVSTPLPVASLETAYADKLTAFATRPHLKWRDIYDLWWIATQSPAKLGLEQVSEQFLHNVKAYRTVDDLPPAQALRRFLENDPKGVVARADPDISRWLPRPLWQLLNPSGVEEMVDYVYGSLDAVASHIEGASTDIDLKRLAQRER